MTGWLTSAYFSNNHPLVLESVKKHLKFDFQKFVKKRVPITSWFPQYTLSLLFQDLLAGITVGMTEIPQGIAYAIVAGKQPTKSPLVLKPQT